MRSSTVRSIDTFSLETTLDPKLYRLVESLAKTALAYGANHHDVRSAVGNLCLHLQQESINKYGSLTIDVINLKKVLEKSNSEYQHERPAPRLDPIQELGVRNELVPDQQAAAILIRTIYTGFQKYLNVASRSYEAPSKKNRVLQPLELIDSKTFRLYRDVFTPWFTKAKQQPIKNRNGECFTNEGDICIIIIVECLFPKEVEAIRNLPLGSSLRTLKKQLNLFNQYL